MKEIWRRLIRNDLRSRVMLTLLIFSMVPLGIAAYQGYHCGRLAVVDLTKLHVTSVIEARHRMISEWMVERENDVLGLVALPGLRDLLELQDEDDAVLASARETLESVAAEDSPYESIALYATDWSPVLKIDHGEHAEDEILLDSFVEEIDETTGIYFDVAHEHETGEIGIHFGSTVRNKDETIVGYMVANLNLSESISPLLKDRSGLWRTGNAFVISQDLEIISQPNSDSTAPFIQKSANPILLETVRGEGQDVRIYRGYSGQEVIGTSVPLPFKDWLAVVEIDAAEAMNWIDVLLFRVAITLASALAAILVVGLFLSKSIARPFVEIAGVAHKIREGDIEATVARSGIQEAEEMRTAFDRMLSELRRNERLLVQSGRMAAIGELTSSIVHEMRNPLSSIKMNLRALQKDTESDWQSDELLEIASEQTQRLEQMLAELLLYGRASELNVANTTFAEIANCCLEASRESIAHNSAEVEIRDHLETRPIWTDKELVCRILGNLVRNAAEAAGAGARIVILAEVAMESESEIKLEVHDNGPGVPSEQSGRIFAPFHTTKPDGIGLGLAVVKNYVDALGGSVEVTRSPEGGAAFVVRLPNQIADPRALGE